VLASRRGPAAPGAAVLAARTAGRGAHARIAVCDVTDRDQLTAVVTRIGTGRYPLTAVMHTAAVLDDVVIDDVDTALMAAVAGPKVSAAHVLDEVTAGLDLDAFVLFSSGAATWGSAGQSVYAAANAVLDALAQDRRARGLPATSVAWGPWAGGGLVSSRAEEYLRRRGLTTLPPGLALAALGQAIAGGETLLTVADIAWDRFAPAFVSGRPSPLLSDLPETQELSTPAGDTGQQGESSWARRVVALAPSEREQAVLDLVCSQVAVVLGHAGPEEVEPDRAFKDLGFDSLTAVELRNRLGAVTGLTLPTTLAFDHPNPMTLAAHLRSHLVPEEASASELILAELNQLDRKLSSVGADSDARTDITRRLRSMLSNWLGTQEVADDDGSADFAYQSATPDEVFSYLDNELGLS
jgi:acyl carrier protein